MYDVIHVHRRGGQRPLARGLARSAACEMARSEARKRGIGRMFLAGSESAQRGELIVIVESAADAT